MNRKKKRKSKGKEEEARRKTLNLTSADKTPTRSGKGLTTLQPPMAMEAAGVAGLLPRAAAAGSHGHQPGGSAQHPSAA